MQWATPPAPRSSATSNGSSTKEEEEESSGVIANLSGTLEVRQTGKSGVDLALVLNDMRNQTLAGPSRVRQVNGRTCVDLGKVWADEGFDNKMKQVTVKAMSAAYFRLLERHPKMKEVFQLGKDIVWVAPNGCALVIAADKGAETMSDADIDALFIAKK